MKTIFAIAGVLAVAGAAVYVYKNKHPQPAPVVINNTIVRPPVIREPRANVAPVSSASGMGLVQQLVNP
jgi:hypothetical protein